MRVLIRHEMVFYVNVGHSLFSHWKLIERPHILGVELEWRIKSLPKNFWSSVLNFTTPRYTLLFSYSKIYIAYVIYYEWSRSVIILLRTCIFPAHNARTSNASRKLRYRRIKSVHVGVELLNDHGGTSDWGAIKWHPTPTVDDSEKSSVREIKKKWLGNPNECLI